MQAKIDGHRNVRNDNTNPKSGRQGTRSNKKNRSAKNDRRQSSARGKEVKKNGAGKFAWGGNVPENEDDYDREEVEIYTPTERKSLTLGDFMGF